MIIIRGEGRYGMAGNERKKKKKENSMTQDERWNIRYQEVKDFIESNKRNPSKYVAEERLMVHFLKRGRKMINAGELKEPRLSLFKDLLVLSKQYKRKNQWK